MKKFIFAAALVCLTATAGLAQATKPDDSSLGTKAMKDQPGTSAGGGTAMPNAKADDADKSISGKAMDDQPGTMGGDTKDPTAKPMDGSISDKAMKDAPGTK
jgi:hypothetical protein